METNRVLGVDVREVREVERDGQPARAVEGTRYYPTDREDLWRALTDPDRLERWFLPIEGDLRPGGRYQLKGNAEGTIVRCDPPEALDVTWEFAGNVSWVSVRLTSEGDGARLALVHTMLQDEASEEHWATYGAGATGVGWDLSFWGLGRYLDRGGEAGEPGADEAWLGTDDGKRFIRACAESWGRAHADSGEDEGVARAMAERTASFYTGE